MSQLTSLEAKTNFYLCSSFAGVRLLATNAPEHALLVPEHVSFSYEEVAAAIAERALNEPMSRLPRAVEVVYDDPTATDHQMLVEDLSRIAAQRHYDALEPGQEFNPWRQ